jgi:amidohydrolase
MARGPRVTAGGAAAAKAEALARIQARRPALVELSHRIHAHPELGFEEERASAWLAEALDEEGLAVEAGVFGLPTAFRALAGSGPLSLAVCAEYDALPGIGHACGHNVIAAIAIGVAAGLAPLADDLGVSLAVVGTPAEELGNGKATLLDRGAFDGVHAAMMAHPAPLDVLEPPLLAFSQLEVRYRSEASPVVDGRSSQAIDALTTAEVAIGLLRARLRPTDRVHGVVTTDAGGSAGASTMVRAATVADLHDVEARVRRCFEAGAVAAGAELEIVRAHEPYAEMRHDRGIATLYRRNAEAVGRVFLDVSAFLERGTGSTDMGNVSQVLPAIHPAIGIDSLPAANHQPEFAAHCVTPAADRALFDAAVALAWTAIDLATDARLRRRLLERRTSG